MKQVYVLEYTATDGYYTDSFVLKPCFSSLDKAVSYVKEKYQDAKEIKNDSSRAIKSFDLNPYADFQMIEIHEMKVE